MVRVLSEGVGLFLLPFVAYAVLLLLQRRYPPVRAAWENGTVFWLTGAGLGVAILGLVLLGLVSERHRGAYVPAHIEDGRLVPGQMQ